MEGENEIHLCMVVVFDANMTLPVDVSDPVEELHRKAQEELQLMKLNTKHDMEDQGVLSRSYKPGFF